MADVFEFDALAAPPDLPLDSANAAERLQAMADRARRAGHAEGFQAGQAEARAAAASGLQAVSAALDRTATDAREFVEQAEQAAVSLALLIAERVVAAELNARPELVLEVVAGALRRVTERDRLVIEVAPEDLELVRAAAADLAGRLGGIRELEVVAERRVGRGGCVLRTPHGEIDARISEQLVRLAEVLHEAHRRPEDA